MTITILGTPIKHTKSLFKQIISNSYIISNAKQLCSKKPIVMPPKQPSSILYVSQKEFATVPCNGSIDYIGSEEATTCHILFMRSSVSGKSCVSHLDGSTGQIGGKNCQLIRMLNTFTNDEQSKGIDVHVCGGFSDESSFKLSTSLFNAMHMSNVTFNLLTACVCELNNRRRDDGLDEPVIRGVAMEMKSGSIFPATFPEKYRGPDRALRSVRSFLGESHLENIYNPEKNQLVFGPYAYKNFEMASVLLNLPDEILLENSSTSPHCEAPDFVKNMKLSLQFVINNPDWKKFFNNMPRVYELDKTDGLWKRAQVKN